MPDAKKRHPEVTLTLLLPYPMSRIPAEFDGTFTPPGIETVSRRFAIVYANRYMIAHSDCLIAYVTHTGSNAARYLTLVQARLGELRVENLGDVPPLRHGSCRATSPQGEALSGAKQKAPLEGSCRRSRLRGVRHSKKDRHPTRCACLYCSNNFAVGTSKT